MVLSHRIGEMKHKAVGGNITKITEHGRTLYEQKLKDYEFTKKILERLFMEV